MLPASRVNPLLHYLRRMSWAWLVSWRAPVGAGSPANTGKAGAMQRVASATSSEHSPFQV
ncbi:hypothetical protein PRJ_2654 [Pseudomonas sp. XWY-1]|nr:hypothetical protein PRJ_2654 [Pseudomonas sp. XWY-1]